MDKSVSIMRDHLLRIMITDGVSINKLARDININHRSLGLFMKSKCNTTLPLLCKIKKFIEIYNKEELGIDLLNVFKFR